MGEEILFETHKIHESNGIEGYLKRTQRIRSADRRYIDIKASYTRTEQMEHLKTLKLRFALGDTFPDS